MDEVRVGIVGLGVGRANARSLQKNSRGRVTAICDIIEWKMERFAPELPEPVKCYVDYREMCADPEIDAVMVATPNPVHVPVALEAVKNGKHVLVTKPLAHSEDAARELVEAAEAAGVVNMMSLGIHALAACAAAASRTGTQLSLSREGVHSVTWVSMCSTWRGGCWASRNPSVLWG
ncbi:MAG: Gfo/Idh/MocA family oxidoreductase [Anaerolineae bacterium]|nr:Gfo/Idh/MocA family oxidoreductase [Anaerolineae bacterium]